MKVIKEGRDKAEFWRGIWQCEGCGRQIEFEEQDVPLIKLPDGTPDSPEQWKYVVGSWFNTSYMYGPCPKCSEKKKFHPFVEKDQEEV
jgi:uncharacterized protein (DUF983 family)